MKLKNITKIFLLAQVLDPITTVIGLNLGQGIYEINPFVNKIGWFTVIPIKIIGTLVVAFILQLMNTENKPYWIVTVPPIGVVIMNILVILATLFS